MFSNLVSLLCLLNIGIGSSLNQSWTTGPINEELKTKLLCATSNNIDVTKQVNFTVTNGLDAAAFELVGLATGFGIIIYTFTPTHQKSRIAGGRTLPTSFTEHEKESPFETMKYAQEYAEHLLSLMNNKLESFDTSTWSAMVLKLNFTMTLTMLEWIKDTSTGKDNESYEDCWGVIFSTSLTNSSQPLFGFAVGAKVNKESTPFIIGFSDFTTMKSMSRRALFEYFKYRYAFGPIVQVERLFNGNEAQARAFFESQLSEISAKVFPFVNARAAAQGISFTMKLTIIYAWLLATDRYTAIVQLNIKYTVGIFENFCSDTGIDVLYFYVEHKNDRDRPRFHLGPFQNAVHSATLMLIDFLDRIDARGNIGQVYKLKEPETMLGKVIRMLDYSATTCVNLGRGNHEKTSLVDQILGALRRLLVHFKDNDLNRIGALILSETSRAWRTMEMIKGLFGDQIFELLRIPRPDLRYLVGEQILGNVNDVKPVEIEGFQVLIEARIKKRLQGTEAQEKENHERKKPATEIEQPVVIYSIQLSAVFNVGGETAYLYHVIEKQTQTTGNKAVENLVFEFLVEEREQSSEKVISELFVPQNSMLWRHLVQDYLLARQFAKIDNDGEGKVLEPSEVKNLLAIILTLELVARKFYSCPFQTLAVNQTSYINTAIAMLKIMKMEGNLMRLPVLHALIAKDILEKTDITFAELCSLLGEDVACAVTLGNGRDLVITEKTAEKDALQFAEAILIQMVVMIYETRQLIQQCHVNREAARNEIVANKEVFLGWKGSLKVYLAVKHDEELVKPIENLQLALDSEIAKAYYHHFYQYLQNNGRIGINTV